MYALEENWEQVKETIRKEYDLMDISYSTWIAPLKLYKVENKTVTIIIPSEKAHSLSYISSKYTDFFRVTISEMMNDTYDICFILEKDATALSGKEENRNDYFNIVYENANLNPKYRFDNFVVGDNNKFAHSAALAVAETPGITYNPLFLFGGPGLGKTHLMHSIGHFVLEQNPEKRVIYVTSEQFTNEVIASIRSGNAAAMTKLRDKYRTVDVLMVDDIQFIIGKESTQEEFFNTFNVLHESGKQIILSSDRPPKEIETLDQRFSSRFEMGLTCDIKLPNYETRVAILQKKAEQDNNKIDNSIFEYIAENMKTSVRELEGAYHKIVAYSRMNMIHLEDITLEHAKEALRDVVGSGDVKELTPDTILSLVSEHFNIPVDNIKSSKRNNEIVLPRQIFMYLCREKLPKCSLMDIAKFLNKKDHTTVIHGINKIEVLIVENEEIRNKVNAIMNLLG